MENTVGKYIKEQLDKERLSMRKLSELTKINVSTISRITNGKRKPTNEHLQKISEALHVPLEELLQRNGIPIQSTPDAAADDMYRSIRMIDQFLKQSETNYEPFSITQVEKQLQSYEQYAQTGEGQKIIKDRFKEKQEKTGNAGAYMEKLQFMYDSILHKKGKPRQLALMGAALIYFIFTMDVIPDYLFPIGYLDDALAVQVVMSLLSNNY